MSSREVSIEFVISGGSGKLTTRSAFTELLHKWEDIFTMSVGKRIEAIRKRAELSQEAFAEKLGFSRRTLHAWEKDLTPPPIVALVRIREVFDVDPEWVIMGDDLTPPRHYHQINWDLYDEAVREVAKIAAEVRLVLTNQQLERLARIEYANGARFAGPERARLIEYMRTFSLER